MSLQDLLAALGVVLNGIPQGLLALSFGFAALPTAFAFIVGIIGTSFFHSVAPISFQAETITLAGRLSKKKNERIKLQPLVWKFWTNSTVVRGAC